MQGWVGVLSVLSAPESLAVDATCEPLDGLIVVLCRSCVLPSRAAWAPFDSLFRREPFFDPVTRLLLLEATSSPPSASLMWVVCAAFTQCSCSSTPHQSLPTTDVNQSPLLCFSQVILKAFGAAAGSQGCMNNFTFGNARMGYYETIAGGE
jgi:hypothetical protein